MRRHVHSVHGIEYTINVVLMLLRNEAILGFGFELT